MRPFSSATHTNNRSNLSLSQHHIIFPSGAGILLSFPAHVRCWSLALSVFFFVCVFLPCGVWWCAYCCCRLSLRVLAVCFCAPLRSRSLACLSGNHHPTHMKKTRPTCNSVFPRHLVGTPTFRRLIRLQTVSVGCNFENAENEVYFFYTPESQQQSIVQAAVLTFMVDTVIASCFTWRRPDLAPRLSSEQAFVCYRNNSLRKRVGIQHATAQCFNKSS